MDQFFTIKHKAEMEMKREKEQQRLEKIKVLEVNRKLTEMVKNGTDPEDEEFKKLQIEYSKLPQLTQEDIEEIKKGESEPEKETNKDDTQKKPETKESEKQKEDPKTTKEKVEHTIKHFGIDKSISPEFKNLTEAQQFLVLNSLQNRIIDVIKHDAETQYSEELKNKMTRVAEDAGFFAKTLNKIKNVGTGIKEKFTKEFNIKNIESELFEKLLTGEDGKKFINETLEQLTEVNKDRNVEINENGKPIINFAEQLNINTENMSEEEKRVTYEAIMAYNEIANKWRNIPYEWGQEGKKITSQEKKKFESGHRKIYDETKEEYEEARRRILEIKTKNVSNKEKGVIAYELAQLSNSLQLDQLINTHPEFEKEIKNLSNTAGGKEFLKTGQGLMGGKSGSFGLAFSAGYGLRKGTKILTGLASFGTTAGTLTTLIAAPIIGATIGTWKARLRGRDTLRKNEMLARYGKEDKSKERVVVVEAEHLSEKLNKLVEQVMISTGEEKSKNLAMLNTRIEHTLGKIEKGQVNFGDPKNALAIQMRLTETLNKATVVNETFTKEKDNTFNRGINSLLYHTGKGISERTSEAQQKFIEKQMIKGAIIGAVGGAMGYGFRALGEHFGWWGDHTDMKEINQKLGVEDVEHKTQAGQVINLTQILERKPNGDMVIKTPDGNIKTISLDRSSITQTPEGKTIIQQPNGEKIEIGSNKTIENNSANNVNINQPEISKNIPKNISGIEKEFSIKLGESGVPKNLETVFNTISADRLNINAGGIVDEEFATKSLNMSANLVRLVDGQNTAGISADEFKNAVSFEKGVLNIKDHIKFNEILDKLKDHSDDLWEKGALQGKDGAITYIPRISKEGWLKIAHGDGIQEVNGEKTGIVGQDATDVKDFANSEIIKKAGGVASYEDLASKQTSPENITGLADQQIDPLTEKSITNLADQQVDPTIPEEARLGKPTTEDTYLENKIPRSPEQNLGNPVDSNSVENRIYENVNLTEKEMSEVLNFKEKNVSKLFENEKLWEDVKNSSYTTAKVITKMTEEEIRPEYQPLHSYLLKLRNVTGLYPKEANLLRDDETIQEYITRCLKKAFKMGKLDDLKVEK